MKEKEFISLLSLAFGCSEKNHRLPKAWNKIIGENFILAMENTEDNSPVFTKSRISKLKQMISIALEIYTEGDSRPIGRNSPYIRNAFVALYRMLSSFDRLDAACCLLRAIIYLSCNDLRGDTPDKIETIKDPVVISELFLWAITRGYRDSVSPRYLDTICTLVYQYFYLLLTRILPRIESGTVEEYLSDLDSCKLLFANLIRIHLADFEQMKSEMFLKDNIIDKNAIYIISKLKDITFNKAPKCSLRDELDKIVPKERRIIMLESFISDNKGTKKTGQWDAGPSVIIDIIENVLQDLWCDSLVCDQDYYYDLHYYGANTIITDGASMMYRTTIIYLLMHRFLVVKWIGGDITDETIDMCVVIENNCYSELVYDKGRIETQFDQMKYFLINFKKMTTNEQRFNDIQRFVSEEQLLFVFACGLCSFSRNSKSKTEPNVNLIYDKYVKSIYVEPLLDRFNKSNDEA